MFIFDKETNEKKKNLASISVDLGMTNISLATIQCDKFIVQSVSKVCHGRAVKLVPLVYVLIFTDSHLIIVYSLIRY